MAAATPHYKPSPADVTLSIDFGTSHCRMAVCVNGQVWPVVDARGFSTIASCIVFGEDGPVVGNEAKEWTQDPSFKYQTSTVYDVLRLLGAHYSDEHVRRFARFASFDIVDDRDSILVRTVLNGVTSEHTLVDLCALLFGHLKRTAEADAGFSIRKVILIAPLPFAVLADTRCSLLVAAAAAAGLDVVRLVSAQEAAAFAFAQAFHGSTTLFIADIGSGFGGAAVVKCEHGKSSVIASQCCEQDVVASDLDMALMEECLVNIKAAYGIDMSNNKQFLLKLRLACESAKHKQLTDVSINTGAQIVTCRIDTSVLETRCTAQMASGLRQLLQATIDAARVDWTDLPHILLHGGCARIPWVYAHLRTALQSSVGEWEPGATADADTMCAHGGALLVGAEWAIPSSRTYRQTRFTDPIPPPIFPFAEPESGVTHAPTSAPSVSPTAPAQDPNAIGIDFGTHNCWVSVLTRIGRGAIDTLCRFAPCVTLSTTDVTFGTELTHPSSPGVVAVSDIVWLVGRRFSDPAVATMRISRGYTLVAGPNDQLLFEVTQNSVTVTWRPEDVCLRLFEHIKHVLSLARGTSVTLVVPPTFPIEQRQAMCDIAAAADMTVTAFINSGAAALISRGQTFAAVERTTLVCHFGAESLQLTVARVHDMHFEQCAVGRVAFDSQAIDRALADFCTRDMTNRNIPCNAQLQRHLLLVCERTKVLLCTRKEVLIDLYDNHSLVYSTAMSRQMLEHLCSPMLKVLSTDVARFLRDNDIPTIRDLVFHGTASRMPCLRRVVTDVLHGSPHSVSDLSDATATAANGAMLLAASTGNLLDRRVMREHMPFDVAVRVFGGVLEVVIPRHMPLPARASRLFTTLQNNQFAALLEVYAGASFKVREACSVGKLLLRGIPARPHGVPQIQVTCEVTLRGTLEVVAEVLGTPAVAKSAMCLWPWSCEMPAVPGDGADDKEFRSSSIVPFRFFSEAPAFQFPVNAAPTAASVNGGTGSTPRTPAALHRRNPASAMSPGPQSTPRRQPRIRNRCYT